MGGGGWCRGIIGIEGGGGLALVGGCGELDGGFGMAKGNVNALLGIMIGVIVLWVCAVSSGGLARKWLPYLIASFVEYIRMAHERDTWLEYAFVEKDSYLIQPTVVRARFVTFSWTFAAARPTIKIIFQ